MLIPPTGSSGNDLLIEHKIKVYINLEFRNFSFSNMFQALFKNTKIKNMFSISYIFWRV